MPGQVVADDALMESGLRRFGCGLGLRVLALIGDAGYCGSPLSGNGTAMAMVGAYVLAGELARSRDDYSTAFTRYQDVLRPYVTECQKLPPGGVNGFLPASRSAIAMRNLSVRAMTSAPLRAMMAKSLQKADAISLTDYREFESVAAGHH
jgi:2-polyprenyl-6-methoxyphenol hydroxylase-like FAD-dependent oxidoreductase